MVGSDKALEIFKVDCGDAVAIRDENPLLRKPEVVTCHNCGQVISLSAVFCPNCRERCSTENKGKVVQRSICPHCSTPNDVDRGFCSYCFFDLTNAPIEDFSVDYVEAAKQSEEKILQTVLKNESGNRKLCPACGTLNAESDVFCLHCGTEIIIVLPSKYCPNCGGKNQSDANMCCHCQTPFEGMEKSVSNNFWVCKCKHVNESGAVFCEDCGRARKRPKAIKNR